MLKSYIPEYTITSINGSGVLKALQNDSLPELDLLVREAVQNSADAALDMEGDSSNVSFKIGEFVPWKLNCEFESIYTVLNERFSGGSATFLEIRDSKTVGLTGPVDVEHIAGNDGDHGNYFKLVFENGQEQTNSNAGQAGGSWGYGKSVYYRVGIGLVLFYSRIKTSTGFESRLVASLVEHDKTGESILKEVQRDSIGRAWWGARTSSAQEQVFPISDEGYIERLLDIFSLRPFSGEQTGTSIVIPYINEERLLKGIFPDECGVSEEVIQTCSWKDSVSEYIELAVQKWYAPRIFNKHLDQFPEHKWLMVRVNEVSIRTQNMRPFFVLSQELYNAGLSENAGIHYTPTSFPMIKTIPIPSKKVEGGIAGHLALAKVNAADFGQNNSTISPYVYLRLFTKTPLNDPIVMFARTPGMILSYRIEGEWAKGLKRPEGDDEFVVMFFVPKCEAKLKSSISDPEYKDMPLGEYLRKCEKSDHLDWNDASNLTVITNIRKQIISKANDALSEDDDTVLEGTVSKLSGRLGKRLLPSTKFGRQRPGGGGGGGGGGAAASNYALDLKTPAFFSDHLEIDFTLTLFNSRKRIEIGLLVEDEAGSGLDAVSWRNKLATEFPCKITRIESCEIQAKNTNQKFIYPGACQKDLPLISNAISQIELLFDEHGDTSGFVVSNSVTNTVLTGKIVIESKERIYRLLLNEIKRMGAKNE